MRKTSNFLFILYEFIAVILSIAIGFAFAGIHSIEWDTILVFCIIIAHNAFSIWYIRKTTIQPYWTVVMLVPALISMLFYGWLGFQNMIDYFRDRPDLFWARGVCLTLFAFIVIACRITKTVIIFRKFHSRMQ